MASKSELKANSIAAMSARKLDGKGLRVAIVHTQWNVDVVHALKAGCKAELLKLGVAPSDVLVTQVPGAYELPLACQRLIASEQVDAVVAIGCLIKGETMHFEYICEAVSHGLMRLQLDTGVPVMFGVLTVLKEEQAKARAGMTSEGHNEGVEWAQTAIEMARLNQQHPVRGCPVAGHCGRRGYGRGHGCYFHAMHALHLVTVGALAVGVFSILKKMK